MGKLKLKKNDLVQVIAGKDKGRSGKIIDFTKDQQRVLVEGLNQAKRHVKKSEQYPSGGTVSMTLPIHISNVAIIDPSTQKPSRIAIRRVDGKVERIAKKSGAVIPASEARGA